MFKGLDALDLHAQREMKKDKKEKHEFELREEKDDTQWLMSHVAGRRVIWRLLEATGVYRLSFTGDSATTFFREGARNVGLELLAKLHNYCPDNYNKMVKECGMGIKEESLEDFI